jgi:hemolysin activation/secretion protein
MYLLPRPTCTLRATVAIGLACLVWGWGGKTCAADKNGPAEGPPPLGVKLAPEPPVPDAEVGDIYVAEYRVRGTKLLDGTEIGNAVYPYLGPARTEAHIEQARVALEKAYHNKGFQTVSVSVPAQSGARGIIFLEVTETRIGKVRVNGANYFLPSSIRRRAKSLQPGMVPNFEDVQKDIVRLNSQADLRVTPALTEGSEPGTVDIDLNVEDTFPLHGSLELNNRYSENTVPLRLSGSLNYANLWGLGHTIGGSFQVAPERTEDALIFSAFYSLPVTERWSLMFSGMKQDSDVSTLGGAAVVGRGEIYGIKANFNLPMAGNYYHTLSLGLDYKHFDEDVEFGGALTQTPIDYYPMTLAYYGSLRGDSGGFTEGNLSANWHHRGMGSDVVNFDNKRFNADGSYIYFRGDLAHTRDLPWGFQAMGKVQGQYTTYPLINTEQYAGGGLSTVRGYLESAALGDYGWFGTFELRSPSFLKRWAKAWLAKNRKDSDENAAYEPDRNEWRVYGFLEGGQLFVNDALPEQTDMFELASVGVGSRLKLWNTISGSVDVAMPLRTLGTTEKDEWFVSFRLLSEF